MVKADFELLKKLRSETQASIADCGASLEEENNNYDKAREWLRKRGFEKAEKKADRMTGQGLIEPYVHQNGKIGVLVEVLCETDFVARTSEFKNLAHEIAMQIAALDPKDVEALLKQEYIRDSSKTIQEFLKETIAKLGENITIKRFSRLAIGE